jgi:hypothetical protein
VELNVGGCSSRSYDFNGTMGKNIHAKRAQAPSNPNVVIIVSIFSSRSMLLMVPPRLDRLPLIYCVLIYGISRKT